MRACALVLPFAIAGCAGDPIESATSGAGDEDSTGAGDSGATIGSTSTITTTQGATTASTAVDVDSGGDPSGATLDDATTQGDGTTSDADTGVATTGASEATTDGDASHGTSTGDDTCVDVNEPDQDEGGAVGLGAVACDGDDVEIAGVGDVATSPDWIWFDGVWDAATCGAVSSQPRVEVIDGGPLPVCAFADCMGAGVGCEVGVGAVSGSGRPGCCGTDEVRLAVDCTGSDEGANVLVEIDTTSLACTPYTLRLSL